jgi:hypothetical protein
MSQQNVGKVISRLLAEEDLRIRFALDPLDTLVEFHSRGMTLTPDEIDVFVYSDVRLWFTENGLAGGCLH